MLIKVEPDLLAWEEWAEKDGSVHPLAIAFAKFKPGVVFAEAIPDKTGPFCTPRTLVKTSYLIDKLPLEAFYGGGRRVRWARALALSWWPSC
ncbi:MAG: hypothetical protein HC794_01125, partial [Nitrospiraceae bacterium]|nr:hypothetical protein [Nitrospiraceae bacterium]